MFRKTKIQKTYNLLIQSWILIMAYGFLYYQVFYQTTLPTIMSWLRNNNLQTQDLGIWGTVVVLMVVNWGIEAFKWKYLMSKIEYIPFLKAYQAVLTGITISSFTPNRIGEYFGRVFILRNGNRVEGILITVLGSMGQLLVTLLAGSIGFIVLIVYFLTPSWVFSGYFLIPLIALVIGFNLILIGLFFHVSFLSGLIQKVSGSRLNKVQKFFRIFDCYTSKELLVILVLSAFRYLLFSTQFYLLLQLFGVTITLPEAWMLISVIFLVLAIIPSVALAELGIRGSVAVYFFSLCFTQSNGMTEPFTLGVLAASVMLWVINLGIPAIAGTGFIFRLKFFIRNPQQ